MMEHTEFCKCGRILTLEQMKTNRLCWKCGSKHAQDFHRRFDINQKRFDLEREEK
jgi:hypothetical protein